MNIEAFIGEKRAELEGVCEQRSVARLEIFGSVAKGEADRESSDLDLLVEFKELTPSDAVDAFFGLIEDLERLFRRKVDLVTISAIKNPYFLKNIEPDRKVLYAA